MAIVASQSKCIPSIASNERLLGVGEDEWELGRGSVHGSCFRSKVAITIHSKIAGSHGSC